MYFWELIVQIAIKHWRFTEVSNKIIQVRPVSMAGYFSLAMYRHGTGRPRLWDLDS